jgi:hypothetical protein
MPQPKLSKSVQQLAEMKREAARNIDDPSPTDVERALGSYDAIVAAREAERAALLERIGATAQPEPPRASLADLLTKASSGADKLAALDTAERNGQRAAEEEDQERARQLIAPHRERGHGAVTRMGQLKAKYADRVSKAAALDLKAIFKRVPARVTPGQDYAANHFAIERYVRLAREITDTFRSFSPVDFTDGVRSAESYVYRGSSSPEFLNEIRRHLPWHTDRLVGSVASVEERLARFEKLEAAITEDLAGVELVDVAPDPKPDFLAPMPPTPRRSSDTSFYDWDPREPAPTPPLGPSVTRLGGDGEGLRVNGLEGMTEKSDRVKVYGITGGQA